MLQPVSRIVDLLDPALNRLGNMSVDEARRRVLAGEPDGVRGIDGSFALVAAEGVTVRLARSLDRPMRYFLAKRHEGPALYVADRIDTLHARARRPTAWRISSTRATRAWSPPTTSSRSRSSAVRTRIRSTRGSSRRSRMRCPRRSTRSAAATSARWRREIEQWLRHVDSGPARNEPIGVAFSGGIDSGAVFLVTYHTMIRLGLSPARLKAFVLNLGAGPDLDQARAFLSAVGLSLFLEEIDASPDGLDIEETLRVLEDYKPLDVECAAMGLELCRGIRARYPDWRHLADGDGGDENLKDYPIEENHELTIRSVIDNLMLYQEGWGVGRIKHSLTYSGGLSRSYVRTYAPARRYGFAGFSPYTQPAVIEVAEGIPFAALTRYDVPTLYALKGEIVGRGVKAVTGFDMPVFPKRRFQHGAMPADAMRTRLGGTEQSLSPRLPRAVRVMNRRSGGQAGFEAPASWPPDLLF